MDGGMAGGQGTDGRTLSAQLGAVFLLPSTGWLWKVSEQRAQSDFHIRTTKGPGAGAMAWRRGEF